MTNQNCQNRLSPSRINESGRSNYIFIFRKIYKPIIWKILQFYACLFKCYINLLTDENNNETLFKIKIVLFEEYFFLLK